MTTLDEEPLAQEASEDSRLVAGLRLLERDDIDVLSLDIFDTLLWRTVPEPADAFVLLGQRLAEQGRLPPHLTPEVFARLREEAERRARRNLADDVAAPEVTLEQVWDELAPHVFEGMSGHELADLEVEFERSITFPDLEVTRFAQLAQEKHGARLVLVSDTYYSDRQLRRILDRAPFTALDIEHVFTSSQYKIGKGSGIFKQVLKHLEVAPGRVLHIGDHDDADVAAPAKLGINTLHFDKFPEPFRTVVEREGTVRSAGAHHDRVALDSGGGDFGLTALRSKAMHRSEGAGLPTAVNQYWRFGASVLGPVFTGFADWVHRRAQEEGVDTVWCVMREGEFLSRLVNGARLHLDTPVRARTLWLSRAVCSRAAIFEASEEELKAVLQRRQPPTVAQLLESLGVPFGQVPELFEHGPARLDDPALAEGVISIIAGSADVRATIVTGSAGLRQRLVDYVVGQVGTADGQALLVDLGWGATIQAYLDRALRGAGAPLRTKGLYLLTNQAVVDRTLEGLHAEGFLGTAGLPERAVRWIIRSPEIVEQVCMHDEGSLVDISPALEPVRGTVGQSPVQQLQRGAVQNGILAFQREWARYHEVVPAEQHVLDERAAPLLRQALLRFITAPTTEEATIFGSWLHDENYGSQTAERVISGAEAHHIRYMTPRQFLELPMTRMYWPFGMAALHNPPLAMAASAIAMGVLPAEAFTPSDPLPVRIFLDAGAGFRENRRIATFTNGYGLCYVREVVESRPVYGVKIGFPDGPGVVRLDWMRLAFSLEGRSDPLVVEIETPEQVRQLRREHAAPLAGNVLYGARMAPEIGYRCPGDWPPAYRLEVELGFAWLPSSLGVTGRAPRVEVAKELARKVLGKARAAVRAAGDAADERTPPKVEN
jgi:FMN phosphatase YigB (HAD superfamily)